MKKVILMVSLVALTVAQDANASNARKRALKNTFQVTDEDINNATKTGFSTNDLIDVVKKGDNVKKVTEFQEKTDIKIEELYKQGITFKDVESNKEFSENYEKLKDSTMSKKDFTTFVEEKKEEFVINTFTGDTKIKKLEELAKKKGDDSVNDLIKGRMGLTAIAVPSVEEKNAALALGKTGKFKGTFVDADLQATIKIMTGNAKILRPNQLQIEAAIDLIAGGHGLTGIADPSADEMNAAVALRTFKVNYTDADLQATIKIMTGNAKITKPTQVQIEAAVDLIAGGHGLTGIADPSADEMNAAVILRTFNVNYADVDLANTITIMTGNAKITKPTQVQIEAAIDLITGRYGVLTAIVDPTADELNAAVALRTFKVAYTDADLVAAINMMNKAKISVPTGPQVEAAIDLIAGRRNLTAIAEPTAEAINAAVALRTFKLAYTDADLAATINIMNKAKISVPTGAQVEAAIDLIAGHLNLTPIAEPTADQINVAVILKAIDPNYVDKDLNDALKVVTDLKKGRKDLTAVVNPTVDQIKAASILIGFKVAYTDADLAATVKIMTGAAGLVAPTQAQIEAAVDLIAGRNGLTAVANPSEDQVKAAVILRTFKPAYTDADLAATVKIMTGAAGLVAPTQAQIEAAVDLIAGRNGLTAVANPSEDQVKAAVILGTFKLLYTDADLAATVKIMTGAAGLVAPTQAQIEAAVDLIAGRNGLTAVANPSEDQVKAAVVLNKTALKGAFKTADLAATVKIMTGAAGLVAPTQAQIEAAVDLIAGRAGLTAVLDPSADQVKAAVILIAEGFGGAYVDADLVATVKIMTGAAKIAKPTQVQIEAAVDLIAGHGGLVAVADPSADQVMAAVVLNKTALKGAFKTADLAATVKIMMGAAKIAKPTQVQIEAAVDLIAGRMGVLTAILDPSADQVKAAVVLNETALKGAFTTANLEECVALRAAKVVQDTNAKNLAAVRVLLGAGLGTTLDDIANQVLTPGVRNATPDEITDWKVLDKLGVDATNAVTLAAVATLRVANNLNPEIDDIAKQILITDGNYTNNPSGENIAECVALIKVGAVATDADNLAAARLFLDENREFTAENIEECVMLMAEGVFRDTDAKNLAAVRVLLDGGLNTTIDDIASEVLTPGLRNATVDNVTDWKVLDALGLDGTIAVNLTATANLRIAFNAGPDAGDIANQLLTDAGVGGIDQDKIDECEVLLKAGVVLNTHVDNLKAARAFLDGNVLAPTKEDIELWKAQADALGELKADWQGAIVSALDWITNTLKLPHVEYTNALIELVAADDLGLIENTTDLKVKDVIKGLAKTRYMRAYTLDNLTNNDVFEWDTDQYKLKTAYQKKSTKDVVNYLEDLL